MCMGPAAPGNHIAPSLHVIRRVQALLLAVMADRVMRGASVYKTLLVWPYAVAPVVAGVLFTVFRHDKKHSIESIKCFSHHSVSNL